MDVHLAFANMNFRKLLFMALAGSLKRLTFNLAKTHFQYFQFDIVNSTAYRRASRLLYQIEQRCWVCITNRDDNKSFTAFPAHPSLVGKANMRKLWFVACLIGLLASAQETTYSWL
jgi:hypothetical protein